MQEFKDFMKVSDCSQVSDGASAVVLLSEAAMKKHNKNLKDAPDTVSKDGAPEFWSSGGLMQWVPGDGALSEYEYQTMSPKHIKVITLVEDQAAVAHRQLFTGPDLREQAFEHQVGEGHRAKVGCETVAVEQNPK